ncbi:hypothetical protein TPR58_11455 [Sphingomonas sp. HF-S3]|uniref:DUF998 domain-containing protein n=1 Tax=Sphingomonas rustica TaxID=3103142 RepID=A0ABV0BAP0_9SPHN
MSTDVPHLIMALAERCMPNARLEWGRAMRAEHEQAVLDGRSMSFAMGCLVTAMLEMPRHRAGRFAIAMHALPLGMIVPIAVFHLGCAVSGVRLILSSHDPYSANLAAGGVAGRAASEAYLAAAPALTVLLLLLGLAHLRIAWVMLDGQWRRAGVLWMLAAGLAAAIVAIITAIDSGMRGSAIQVAALAIELVAIPVLATWQRAISTDLMEVR